MEQYVPLLRSGLTSALTEPQPMNDFEDGDEASAYFQGLSNNWEALRANLGVLEEAKPNDQSLLSVHVSAVAFLRAALKGINLRNGALFRDALGDDAEASTMLQQFKTWEPHVNTTAERLMLDLRQLQTSQPQLFTTLGLSPGVFDLLTPRYGSTFPWLDFPLYDSPEPGDTP